jgi:restriction endonuclease S subunit
MNWRTVNLGDLVENFSIRAKDHIAETSSLEFCGVSNSEGITLSKYAAEDKAEDYKIIEKDCFAYNPYRINVGSIGLLENDTVGLISPAYVVFKPKPKSIIPQLLLKFLKSSEGLRQIKLHARGTVRQALRFEDLCKIELSIPDYDSQLELFKRIEETEIETSVLTYELTHQLSLVKQLRQAFLREAMQGKLVPQDSNDEPASVLLEKIKAEKEQLVKVKSIKKEKPLPPISEDEIPFDIPENWVWCRLGELYDVVRGSSPRPKGDPRYWSKSRTPFHWITIADFTPFGSNGRLHDTNGFLTELGSTQSRIVKSGDLLIACSGVGSVGRSIETKIDGFIYDGLLAIRNISNETIKELIRYYLKYKEDQIYSVASGANWLNINIEILCNYFFPLPPLSEQQRIVTKLDELMKLCDNLEASIKKSQQQNVLLLQQVLKEALEQK